MSPRKSVAFAVDEGGPELDESWPMIVGALRDDGFQADLRTWSDPDVDWTTFDLVAVNLCWGYVNHEEEFLRWAGQVESVTTLVNRVDALTWNSDKRYLLELAEKGLPIVPTSLVFPGDDWEPPAVDFVVKPAVSSGGAWSARYEGRAPSAEVHITALHDRGIHVLVQPYQDSVDFRGETDMVYFAGAFSHCVNKGPLLVEGSPPAPSLWEREVIESVAPDRRQRSFADQVVGQVEEMVGPTTYARVDLVEDEGGRPLLLEMELIDPSLSISTSPGSARRFAHALAGAASGH